MYTRFTNTDFYELFSSRDNLKPTSTTTIKSKALVDDPMKTVYSTNFLPAFFISI